VRQHFAGRFAIPDEIVVDEIKAGRTAFLRKYEVQFADQLLRRFHARPAPIQIRDVAKLAKVGTSRGKLQRTQKIFFELDQMIGRVWEIGERNALRARVVNLPRCRGNGASMRANR
jgi:hypothetical protein